MSKDIKEKLEDLLDSALIAVSKDEKRVERAEKAFDELRERFLNQIDEHVFNAWLIHHYRDEFGLVIDLVEGHETLIDAIKGSILGFFAVRRDKAYFIFEDLLTKTQYTLKADDMDHLIDEQAIYFTRLYEHAGTCYMSDDYQQFDKEDGPLIIKNLMGKYNEIGTDNDYTIDGFIKNNPLILYWASNILKEVIYEEPVDYICYEVNCAVVGEEAFKSFINSGEIVATDYDDVYSWFQGEVKRAEVVTDKSKVYIECVSQEDFEWVQGAIEDRELGLAIFETKLTHMDELFDS